MVPSIRAALLFIALAVAACLPNLAAEWLFPISVAGSFGRPGDVPVSEDSATTSLERQWRTLRAGPVDEPEPTPQLYDVHGNEIVLPVSRYGVDHRGSLYELHSPHTELPKLEPPEL